MPLTSTEMLKQGMDTEALLLPGGGSPQASTQAIQVTGLRKTFGEQPVLWDLDLVAGWGECLVIFGANGVGKTTLLKVLSTQARADAGLIRIAGVDVRSDSATVRRTIGVVSHRHMLYEDMTGEENLRFYGRMFGLDDLHFRIAEVLRRVGLERRGGQRVRTLSNGLQKRLAMARAILHRPSILLLDEPESGLDPDALDMLGQIIWSWKQAGRSVLMTTHNMDRGLEWGDRVALLAQGRIAFTEHKQCLDVAEFTSAYRRFLEMAP